jgi:hypothetical protein
MSKWSSLQSNITKSAPSAESPNVVTFFVVTALAIAGSIAIANSIQSENRKVVRVMPVEPALTVIQPKVTMQDSELVAEPVVEPKSVVEPVSVGSKYFSHETFEQGPYLQSENGLSFSDFQEAFQNGREKPIQDRIGTKDLHGLQTLSVALKESGQNVYDFLDTQGLQVSDGLLDAIQQESFLTRSAKTLQTYDHDEMILAQDLFQDVSVSVSADEIVPVLQEIAFAQESFLQFGQAPHMPFEQEQALQYWATTYGHAANLAKKILSRK